MGPPGFSFLFLGESGSGDPGTKYVVPSSTGTVAEDNDSDGLCRALYSRLKGQA